MTLIPWLRPLGVDLFCTGKKFLVFNIVSRNLKIKYRRSVLGILWTLMVPIAMATVYYAVFKLVLKVSVPHYVAFILSGVLPWSFFAQTVIEGMESIVGGWGLLSKLPIPIQVFPFASSSTNLVTLGIAIPALIGGSLVSSVPLSSSLIMLLYYFGTLFLITYSLSLILAVGFVFFRDLRHLMGILMQIWFYATPVIYDSSMVPPNLRWVLYFNPVADIFVGLHQILAQGTWPTFESVGRVAIWATVLMFAAAFLLKRTATDLVEQI